MDRAEIQSFCDNYKYVSRRRNWSEGELTPTRDPGTGYVAKVVLDLRMSYQPSRHPLSVVDVYQIWYERT